MWPFAPSISDETYALATISGDPVARRKCVGTILDEIERQAEKRTACVTSTLEGHVMAAELQKRKAYLVKSISYLTKARLKVPRRGFKTDRVEEQFFAQRGWFIAAFTRGGWPRAQGDIWAATLEVVCTWLQSDVLEEILDPTTNFNRRLWYAM